MHYLTSRLTVLILMFSICLIIGFSEDYFFRGKGISDAIQLSNLELEFENTFWSFSLGDYIFSGLEQIVFILSAIVGLCALEDILIMPKEIIKCL